MGYCIDFLDYEEDENACSIDEDDELYGCTLNDDEFYKFAKEKFFKEKSADVYHIHEWNREYVYPKILTE